MMTNTIEHSIFITVKHNETDMTALKTIFQKPVNRPIEGVIKADDEASLRLELEEYVLTDEVENRLISFFDAYNDYQVANGVWLSGFFGSGKSHLLKILALLLENRQIDNKSALELFLPKCGDNDALSSGIKNAVAIPSKSILFNIDQKADVISKTQVDALLAVFVKVFDEMCGYYGKQGHIAQFERDLDSRKLYGSFKEAYESIANKPWEKGREQAILEAKNIAQAYSQVTGEDQALAMGILDKYRSQYHVSIEDFASQVDDYIERQIKENGYTEFRLNFFVDEVGQYIAENVKLMTNLQTIAESLATKSRGRSWIIVTAQEDMGTVVGEMGKQQSNDFSKIQARFANRMKLTSANVAEVIQKRLLVKTDEGAQLLSGIYDNQSNNFKTLFDFADGSQTYRNFKDKEHFINSYPFIPYQFSLFQSAIADLSLHNAFEGKHSSVGERSMLGVFQQVAIKVGDHDIGQLATFDLMFEGIRTALKSNIQRAVINAETHLDNKFAVQVLKALFLVKYVDGFKSTIRNICVLMLSSFDEDVAVLRQRVEEALNLLEDETYVQRTGDMYEYLTDEEKDIEEEIKNTEVEAADVASELESIIFDQVIKSRKIRYSSGASGSQGQDYSYSRKLDDKLYGREYEIGINVISPFYEHAENEEMMSNKSNFSSDELFVILPADSRLMSDITMYKRTEKYVKQNYSIAQQETVKRILGEKGQQNTKRQAELVQRIKSLMSQAKLLVAGTELNISSEDAQLRIEKGFNELVSRSYPHLRMLGDASYTEADVVKILDSTQQDLLGADMAALAEPERDVLFFIQRNASAAIRTTVKGLLEQFEKKPYGWSYAAVLSTLAKLCVNGKVEVRMDGSILEDRELARALVNSQRQSNLVLEPQVDFSSSQVRHLKEFYEDFFAKPASNNEAKALGNETIDAFKEMLQDLEGWYAQSARYPFLSELEPAIQHTKKLSKSSYAWFLADLNEDIEDELLKIKEQLIDPIYNFMNGSQREIYDNTQNFLKDQSANFDYIEREQVRVLEASLNDTSIYKGSKIQQVKVLLGSLKDKVNDALQEARSQSIEALKQMQSRMQEMDEYKKLPDIRQAELDAPYTQLIDKVNEEKLIAVINDRLRYFEDKGYATLLQKMVVMATPKPPPTPAKVSTNNGDKSDKDQSQVSALSEPKQVSEPKNEYINSNKIRVDYDRAWIENETDVKRYLEAMSEALLSEIRKGKRIYI